MGAELNRCFSLQNTWSVTEKFSKKTEFIQRGNNLSIDSNKLVVEIRKAKEAF